MTRFRQDQVLERWTAPGGKLNPINYLKHVSRFMAATDAVFRYAGSEAKAFVLAYNLGRDKNLTGADLYQAIEATLKLEAPNKEEAMKQAAAEGFTGMARKRRADEIIHMSRDPELQSYADSWGSLAAFQQDPRGVLGIFAKFVNKMANPRTKPGELPEEGVTAGSALAKFFVPFIYTLANVGNVAVDYTPGIGHLRTHITRARSRKGKIKPIDDEVLNDQMYRAHVGTLGTMAIAAMLESAFEDDDPWISITSLGPSNYAEREKLRKAGQLYPYTIKIAGMRWNYLETPLAIPFAFLGHMYDARRYGSEADIGMGERIAYAALLAVNAWTNMSFVKSVDQAMDIATMKDLNEARRKAKDLFSFGAVSFVVPNLVRQLDTVFDPTKTSINDLNTWYHQSVPFARREGYPDVDMYGQNVMRTGGSLPRRLFNRIVRADLPKDPAITLMSEHGSYPSEISKQSTRTRADGKLPVSTLEHYAWQKVSGHEFQRRMMKDLPELRGMDADAFDKRLKDHWNDSRAYGKKVIEAISDAEIEKIARVKLKPATGKKIPPPSVKKEKKPRAPQWWQSPAPKKTRQSKRTTLEWLKHD